MAFRDDIIFILIPIAFFQDFDLGMEVKIPIDERFRLIKDDTFPWECGQFDGTGIVICAEEGFYVVKKVN